MITADGLAFRVLRRQTRAFAQIKRVDLLTFRASAVLRFRFTGCLLTFDAGLGSAVLARQVLELLPAGVPLSGRAAALLGRRGGAPSAQLPSTDGMRSKTGGTQVVPVQRCRPTAGILQRAGLIRYGDGRVKILDRAGLEALTRECYRTVQRRAETVMG